MLALWPAKKTPLLPSDTAPPLALACVRSPKSVVFPAVSQSTYAMSLVQVDVAGPRPPAKRPLDPSEHPAGPVTAAYRSPKSVAFPVFAIVR